MTKDEALSIYDTLTLALEALTATMSTHGFKDAIDEVHDKAITAIKEALAQPEQPKVRTGDCLLVGVCASEGHKIQKAQPEQEPVAWIYEFYADMGHKGLAFEEQHSAYNTPLYTTPPQRTWVGLTVEDIDKSIEDNQRFGGFRKVGFAYDLEEILKEKNT